MPVAFLVVSLVGAAFTFNAHRPRRGQSVLIVPSFFAAWLTSELAAHHLSWQAVATVVFVVLGALSDWPGWVGLAVTIASWIGLLALLSTSRTTHQLVDDALRDGLGAAGVPVPVGSHPLSRRHLLLPFAFGDPAVRRVKNVRYAEGAGRRHLLDVYTPRSGVAGAPVLLQIHGGGWVIGSKNHQGLPLMVHLTARGWVCVAINYRLSPKATFPDHLVDVKLALRWIREHIAEYGGDPARVAVTGGSAGGHLTALTALTANDPEYQPGFEDVDTSVVAAVPFYGVYDWTNSSGRGRGRDGMGGFVERVIVKKKVADDPDAFRRASPLHRVHEGAPPFMVVHGTHDSLVPFGGARRFVEALQAVSPQPVVFVTLPGAQHAFEVFHSLRASYTVRGVERFLTTVFEAPVVTADTLGCKQDLREQAS